jgi:hypothetical protein
MTLHRLKKGTTIRGFAVSSLRTEIRKGRLEAIRIANKDFVTDDAIDQMVKLCSGKKDHGSGSTIEKGELPHGFSVTGNKNAALAYLSTSLKKQSRNLPST